VAAFGLVALGACLLATLALAPLWDPDRRVYHHINALWGRALCATLRFEVELRHGERAAGGPFVVVANHQSRTDLLVTYLLPLPFRTFVKRKYFRTPLGVNLWLAGYVPVETGEATPGATLDGGRRWLARGVSVLVFPEGTRNPGATLKRFKRGAFELAVSAGVPVLPVAMAGNDDVMPHGSWRFHYHQRIVLEVLPPVRTEGRDADAVRREVRAALGERVAALADELYRAGQGERPTPVSAMSTR
jgi:1-acyl-sn-glycerol-3-phosphate acyltransferase